MASNEASNSSEENKEYISPADGDVVPVLDDKESVDEPEDGSARVDPDSDEQLTRDENDAIDPSNIIDERTRGAKPDEGYAEPGDEEGLGGAENETSST